MAEIPFSKFLSQLVGLISSLNEFSVSLLDMLGIPSTISIANYNINVASVFGVAISIIGFIVVVEMFPRLLKYVGIVLILLFALSIMGAMF